MAGARWGGGSFPSGMVALSLMVCAVVALAGIAGGVMDRPSPVARGSAGSSQSSIVAPSASSLDQVGAPGAPTIVAVRVTGTTATIMVLPPASDGGSPITGYTATASPSGISGYRRGAGDVPITVDGLALGVAYSFTVTATNSAGTSVASSPARTEGSHS